MHTSWSQIQNIIMHTSWLQTSHIYIRHGYKYTIYTNVMVTNTQYIYKRHGYKYTIYTYVMVRADGDQFAVGRVGDVNTLVTTLDGHCVHVET